MFGAGISTCCPSATPFGLVLGPDLPWADEPSPRNLRFSTARILTLLSLLIPAFSLLLRPHILSIMLLPFVLGSSPHLPVSVCGTGIFIQDSCAFLASVILDNSLLLIFTIPCGSSFSSSSLIFHSCVPCIF